MTTNLKILPLHENSEWLDSCSEVLNEEWPRSKTARMHMLDKSNPDLPYCLVLLEYGVEDAKLIGHSRLCMVHGKSKACFVESVVIKKDRRGQGFGRKLMEMTEAHALELGYGTVYLTTHDKQDFYEHVGYGYCEPIISLGSASKLLSQDMMDRLFSGLTVDADGMSSRKPAFQFTSEDSEAVLDLNSELIPTCMIDSPLPPPTPTPPPTPSAFAPVAPPLFPFDSSNSSNPVRIDPNKVFWMKKELKC